MLRNGSKARGIEVMKVIKGKHKLFPAEVFENYKKKTK